LLAHEQPPVEAAIHERPRVLDALSRDDHVLGSLAAQHHAREAGDDRHNGMDGLLSHLGVKAELGHPSVNTLRNRGRMPARAFS
jgi:hypothetical protein